MYYNEKRKAITAKYVKTHLDDIKIRVPKGQREKLKSIASEMGIGMNQMFIKAVEEYIEKNYELAKLDELFNIDQDYAGNRVGAPLGEKRLMKEVNKILKEVNKKGLYENGIKQLRNKVVNNSH